MDDKQQRKFEQMTKEPVEGLICRLAVPCIISMLVTAFYNMADIAGHINIHYPGRRLLLRSGQRQLYFPVPG